MKTVSTVCRMRYAYNEFEFACVIVCAQLTRFLSNDWIQNGFSIRFGLTEWDLIVLFCYWMQFE